jgi:uncharacterized membrane protein YgcG
MTPVYAGHPAPSPSPDDGARARGSALRQARLVRARSLRRRIIAGALALFVATWVLITLVLVSGHDPALAKQAASSTSSTPATTTTTSSTPTTTTTSSTPTTTTSSGTGSSSTGSSSTGSSSTGSSSTGSSSTGSVTTHQS